MAPGKLYIHKMENSELAALKDEGPYIIIYWKARARDGHDNIIFKRFPAKVLTAFSDHPKFENAGYATFVGWQKEGVVRVVLQWMLDCCKGEGVQQVKDIAINPTGLISANDDGEFGRYFKTAYLFDFAQEYKIKHLEDKLKRELEFQAKGKYPIKVEEIYDMANYFYQPIRDKTAMDLMIDSIAKGYVKGTLRQEWKYDSELAIWTKDCDCEAREFVCTHNDLPEKVVEQTAFFRDPANAALLNEEFGKKMVEEDASADANGGDDWSKGGGGCGTEDAGGGGEELPHSKAEYGGAEKSEEGNKENQEPSDWASEANEEAAAAADTWGAPAGAGPSGGW